MIQRPRTRSSQHEEKDTAQRRFFTLRLSLLGLLGISVASLVAVVWIFALGVIIGRGYNPEDTMPILGKLMPPTAERAEPEENPEIIKPEDLTFFSELKTQPRLSSEEPVMARTNRAPQAPVAQTPTSQAPASQAAHGRGTTPQPVQPAHLAPAAPGEAPKSAATERFSYVYQVIAYKKPEQADDFRDKLEQAGLRTRLSIEKDKQGKPRIYRIQVLINGTETDRDAALAILARNGVKEPILTSRKAAGQ